MAHRKCSILCFKGCFSPQVMVLLAQSEAFEFVLARKGDVLVVNAQKLILGSHASASALFPIRPVALGQMEISVDAVSAEASDSLVWRALVKVWYDGNTYASDVPVETKMHSEIQCATWHTVNPINNFHVYEA